MFLMVFVEDLKRIKKEISFANNTYSKHQISKTKTDLTKRLYTRWWHSANECSKSLDLTISKKYLNIQTRKLIVIQVIDWEIAQLVFLMCLVCIFCY